MTTQDLTKWKVTNVHPETDLKKTWIEFSKRLRGTTDADEPPEGTSLTFACRDSFVIKRLAHRQCSLSVPDTHRRVA